MGRIYIITSGKGGTGKTTTAINLAAALNNFNESVVLIDANLTTPNIGLHFNAPIVPVNLNHVLRGEADIQDAIYEHESGIKIIPASLSTKDLHNINLENLKKTAIKLSDMFSHVIIDSPAGLGDEARHAINASEDVILVVNPNILSVTDALKTIKLSEEMNKDVKGAIITRVRYDNTEMIPADIKDMLEIPILGIVPEDKHVYEALNKKDAVIHTKPRSKASKAYKDVAAKMIGRKKKPEGFFQSILSGLGFD